MKSMFEEYESPFNFDISKWKVHKVTDMSKIFHLSSFNRNILKWNVDKVTNMEWMLDNIYSSVKKRLCWNLMDKPRNIKNMFTAAVEFYVIDGGSCCNHYDLNLELKQSICN